MKVGGEVEGGRKKEQLTEHGENLMMPKSKKERKTKGRTNSKKK